MTYTKTIYKVQVQYTLNEQIAKKTFHKKLLYRKYKVRKRGLYTKADNEKSKSIIYVCIPKFN